MSSEAWLVARAALEHPDLTAVQAALSRLTPGEAAWHAGLARAGAGDLALAVPWLEAGAVAAADDAERWSDLGAAQWELGAQVPAMESFRRALEADPLHADAFNNYDLARQAMPRLRLLALSDSRSPHTQRFVRYLANQGHDVHLLTDARLEIPGVRVYAPEAPVGVLQFGPWLTLLMQLIRELRPDVVHGHYASIYGLWGALSGFHPYVSTLWGSDINVDPHLGAQYGELIRFGLEQADTIIGQSDDLNQAAIGLARGALAPVRRLTFGIDTTRFVPGMDVSELRAELELGEGPVVLSPRQFKRAANIHRIVEAIPAVLARVPAARFVFNTVLTAEDEYYLELQQLIDRLGVRSVVRILPDVPYDQMPRLYALAAMTLSVRDADGASNTVMESLSSGTPVIASDIASNRELIGPEAGYFVDPHAPGAMAAAILALLEAPAQARALGAAGMRRMQAYHDNGRNMARMEGLYHALGAGELWAGRGPLVRLQRRAVAAAMRGEAATGHALLTRAWAYIRTPRDRARLLLSAELLRHPTLGMERDRLQAAFDAVFSS